MEVLKSNSSSISSQVNNSEAGFANVAFLGLLPAMVLGILILLFTQLITRNWMQSLHTCRVELLKTQDQVGEHLKQLMQLNKLAKTLRLALKMAQVELAAAIAAENPPWIAKVLLRIKQIQAQQKTLDGVQRSLIAISDTKLNFAVFKVVQKIRQQDIQNKLRLPDFVKFRIKNIIPRPTTLAVKPDKPGVAPVYELKPDFKQAQTLHVSWISEFETADKGPIKWLINKHQKKQYCKASLIEDGSSFREILNEDKL